MRILNGNLSAPRRLVGTVALLGLLGAGILSAQSTATISGTVTDASGAAVPGVKLEVKNVDTDIVSTATSDTAGRYRAPELLVGSYEINASHAGFQTVIRKGVTITVGSEAIVDISLKVGQAQQTITVDEQVSQVETTSTAIATLVEQQQMVDLPLNGRNFEQLMSLAPGVITIPNTGGPFYGKSDNYSVSGSRPLGQSMMLDNESIVGFWGHSTGSAATGSSLGLEAISQFQTLTSTYSAQFGGNGGALNASSKSGTNSFHGSVFEFLRNSALDARSPFDTTILPGKTTAHPPAFRRNQFGGSIGGPIKKDKAFFYANYEGVRSATGNSTVVQGLPDANAHQGMLPCTVAGPSYPCSNGLANVGVASSIAPILAYFPVVPASPSGTGNLTEVVTPITHENYFLGRFDYTISSSDTIFARYIFDKATNVSPANFGPFVELDTTLNNFATIEERHIFSPNLVNLFRVALSRPTETQTQQNPNLSILNFAPNQPNGRVALGMGMGATTLGIGGMVPNWLVPTHFTEGDDIIMTHGSHSLRIGATLDRIDDNETTAGALGGTYTFASVLGLLTGAPNSVTIPLPGQIDAERGVRSWAFTPYIQDEWKVNRHLTLNIGLRYDWNSNPSEVNNLLSNITGFANGAITDKAYQKVPNVFSSNITNRNWAPRIGFAYSPFDNAKTSIRGGFGMFYQMLQAKDYMPAYWTSPPFVSGSANNPSFPNPFVGTGPVAPLPSEAQGMFYYANRTPTTYQYNMNVQRDLSRGMILTVGYSGSSNQHLLLARDYNTPQLINGAWATPAVATPGAPGPPPQPGTVTPNVRLNANFAGMVKRNTVGNSNYNGLIMSLNRRFANRWQTQISYTYSKSLDNGSAGQGAEAGPNAANFPTNPYNANADYGLSAFDRKQAVRISGIYELPGHGMLLQGWRLTGIYTRTTGAPIDIMTGFDRSGLGGQADVRPNAVANFSGPLVFGGPNQYLNPAAYSLQSVGTIGNLGRDTVRGPGLSTLDGALLRTFPVKKISEVANVQFRAEFYNLPNHPNWAQPGNSIWTNGLGAGTPNPNFGRVTNIIGTSRQIQFGLRIGF